MSVTDYQDLKLSADKDANQNQSESNNVTRSNNKSDYTNQIDNSLPPIPKDPDFKNIFIDGDDFLSKLNMLIFELNSNKEKSQQTLQDLCIMVNQEAFDFRMYFTDCDGTAYEMLDDFSQVLEEVTPISHILERLAPQPSGSQASIQLLEIAYNRGFDLKLPVYHSSPGYASDVTDNLEILDWYSEKGLLGELDEDGNLISSDPNIEKLNRRLEALSESDDQSISSKRDLFHSIEDLFITSFNNDERYRFLLNDKGFQTDQDTLDAVVVIIKNYEVLPTSICLKLLEHAYLRQYDFHAYGRDYGSGNLLFDLVEDSFKPAPDLSIISFLLDKGLDPTEQIENLHLVHSIDHERLSPIDVLEQSLSYSGASEFPNINEWQQILSLLRG